MIPTDLRDHLLMQAESWAGLGHPALLERFVAKHGTGFTGARRLKPWRKGPAKQCFANSARVFLKGIDYYEGFAIDQRIPIPFLHAWNVTDRGRVIDLTLDKPEEYVYWGVKFDDGTIWREQRRTGVYGLLDSGVGCNVELIRGIDPELVAELEAMRPLGHLRSITA
jgi:hypothetical protein